MATPRRSVGFPHARNLSGSDTDIDSDSAGATDFGSDIDGSQPSSEIDSTPLPQTPPQINRPIKVASDWSPASPVSVQSFDNKAHRLTRPLGAESSQRTIVSEPLPSEFWAILKKFEVNPVDHDFMVYVFEEIWSLREIWELSNPDHFVQKDIPHIEERRCWVLQDILSKLWQLNPAYPDASDDEDASMLHANLDDDDDVSMHHTDSDDDSYQPRLSMWLAFLQRVRVDFWPESRKAVVLDPPFMGLPPSPWPSVSRVSSIGFRMRGGVVRTIRKKDELGTEFFFCMGVQSVGELQYEMKKMAGALDLMSTLQGFVIALVVPTSTGTGYHSPLLALEEDMPALQACLISYERAEFGDFRTCVEEARGLEDWEKETSHFLRLLAWQPHLPASQLQTSPVDGARILKDRLYSIIHSYSYAHLGITPLDRALKRAIPTEPQWKERVDLLAHECLNDIIFFLDQSVGHVAHEFVGGLRGFERGALLETTPVWSRR
ncbi:uncharacterized protein B0H18DRAFT_1126701 [Fomitopsis serialis]|uniref:uncharacterized protein n=1 Tax=Fomitopsis serialis TaxID=139415 RepID=UPI002007BD39|nr:uncharacterized protein B0H18DRAFT_1126701 [Neoantrodia serialis]KAH9912951.1 hypothetical protein B0H18DRAFT_1126701 [Neoantrodia serialis]